MVPILDPRVGARGTPIAAPVFSCGLLQPAARDRFATHSVEPVKSVALRQMRVIVRHFGSNSFGVLNKRHRYAGVDTTERARVPEVVGTPRLSFAAPHGSGSVYGLVNQLPLFERG